MVDSDPNTAEGHPREDPSPSRSVSSRKRKTVVPKRFAAAGVLHNPQAVFPSTSSAIQSNPSNTFEVSATTPLKRRRTRPSLQPTRILAVLAPQLSTEDVLIVGSLWLRKSCTFPAFGLSDVDLGVALSFNDDTRELEFAFSVLPGGVMTVVKAVLESYPERFGTALHYLVNKRLVRLFWPQDVSKSIVCGVEERTQKFSLDLGIAEAAFSTLDDWWDPNALSLDKLWRRHLRVVMDVLFFSSTAAPSTADSTVSRPADDVISFDEQMMENFYTAIRPDPTSVRLPGPLPALTTNPRAYQERAAGWMVSRESFAGQEIGGVALVEELRSKDGVVFYYHRLTGKLSRRVPPRPTDIAGGILADEMGLGKSLEVLMCILSHPRPPVEVSHSLVDEEIISCVCGKKDSNFEGLWIQCGKCMTWQHAECMGFSTDSDAKAEQDYVCHSCTIDTKATMIVCPDALVAQWVEEISKHIRPGSVSVYQYEGIRHHQERQQHPLALVRELARGLQEKDIVITSYSVLRSELDHIPPSETGSGSGEASSFITGGYNLRYEKKYKPMFTPLTFLNWWRLCLDESQMVETTTSKAAEMASALPAVNRWCITGTPIQTAFGDLFGLVSFLHGPFPFSERAWWLKGVEYPYLRKENQDQVHKLFRRIMWRNSKSTVRDELRLPEQLEHTTSLRFSAVESHFYRKQHEECVRLLQSQISNGCNSHPPSILHSVLRLRQACCHPQVGNSKFYSLQQNTMSMQELLNQLIQKAKIECIEAQRELAMTLNGLAAVRMIREEFLEAAELYEQVVAMEGDRKEKGEVDGSLSASIPLDAPQKVHAIANLIEALHRSHESENGERIDQLQKLEEDISRQFVRESELRAEQMLHQMQQAEEAVRNAELDAKRGGLNLHGWWNGALTLLDEKQPHVVTELLGHLKSLFSGHGEQMLAFRTPQEASFIISRRLDKLFAAKQKVIERLRPLMQLPTPEEVSKVAACENCSDSLATPHAPIAKCAFCKAERALSSYEAQLFSSTRKKAATSSSRRGLEEGRDTDERTDALGESLLDRALKLITSEAKRALKGAPEAETIKDHFSAHQRIIDLWKKEWKRMSLWWRARKFHFLELDRLSVAKTRTIQVGANEEVPDYMKPWRLFPGEVDAFDLRHRSQRLSAERKLKEAKGQWLYLQRLRSKHDSKEKTESAAQGTIEENEDSSCPVCYDPIGPQIVVLNCGHALCGGCGEDMIKRSVRGWIRCPLCRTVSNTSEMSYVMNDELQEAPPVAAMSSEGGRNFTGEEEEEKSIPVKGSFGTKLEAIVRRLKWIQVKDPGAKTLVFSQWQDVLELLSRALAENEIEFLRLGKGKTKKMALGTQRTDTLSRFKTDPNATVLLLPLQSGGNGLTLIEATHVCLVEPIPDPALEAQVVSRVHRLGQQRETHVHRFVVQGTIEEAIHQLREKKRKLAHEQVRSTSTDPSSEELRGSIKKTKRQLEELSTQDLRELFGLGTQEDSAVDSLAHCATPGAKGYCESEATKSYWQLEKVQYRGEEVSREEALQRLELAFSWDLRARGSSISDCQDFVIVAERPVHSEVAHRLTALQPAVSSSSSSSSCSSSASRSVERSS